MGVDQKSFIPTYELAGIIWYSKKEDEQKRGIS